MDIIQKFLSKWQVEDASRENNELMILPSMSNYLLYN